MVDQWVRRHNISNDTGGCITRRNTRGMPTRLAGPPNLWASPPVSGIPPRAEVLRPRAPGRARLTAGRRPAYRTALRRASAHRGDRAGRLARIGRNVNNRADRRCWLLLWLARQTEPTGYPTRAAMPTYSVELNGAPID